MVKAWDGQALFYPEIGYEKDGEFVERHPDHLACEGIALDNEDSNDDESSKDEREYKLPMV